MKRILVALLLLVPGASLAQQNDVDTSQGAVTTVPPPPPVADCPRVKYPALAVRLGHEGDTMLEFTVGTDGHVSNVHVSQSSGHDELDQASVAQAACWVYKPAMHHGQPVAVTWRTAVRWRFRGG